MKKGILTVLVLLASASYADTAAVISRAEQLNADARAEHNAWVQTQRFIDKAKTAMVSGDKEGARAAADRAVLLAEASLKQVEAEREAWQQRQLVK